MAINVDDWGTEDVFVSNYGAGPLKARILCVTKDFVTMERTGGRGSRRRVRFDLPTRYAMSDDCGWVLSLPKPSEE